MKCISVFCYFIMIAFSSKSQVTAIVYSENFNSGQAGWSIGGYNPSWSYGIPTLPNIISNGTPCFVTGDAGAATNDPLSLCLPVVAPTITGNFYNCCERSFVVSPAINLTGVNSPLLSIDINVYCEQTFDGAKVQLSVNGGTTWQDVGVYTSNIYQTFPSIKNCREKNWYNKNTINYLSNTGGGCGNVNYTFSGSNSGWSGGCAQIGSGACSNPDIHGTNGWVTAQHCIPAAANKNDVKIRIVFGAGSQIYSDGIAFDNVTIYDVYPVPSFIEISNPACDPEMIFTNTTDCAASYLWNFGHAASGNNTSVNTDPIHIFPASGNYDVSLTATDFCGGVSTFTKNISVNPGNGPVINSITNSNAGLCNSAIDSLIITLSGISQGAEPYQITYDYLGQNYLVQNQTGNPIYISSLQPGLYENILLTDAMGCSFTFANSVIIPFNSDGLLIDAGNDEVIEIGNSIQLNVTSNMIADFIWNPPSTLDDYQSNAPIAFPEATTTYTVTATSLNGCTDSDEVTITVTDNLPCDRFFIPNSFTPNRDGKNDTYFPVVDPSMRIANFSLKIYNRWGQPVFESKNPSEGWDGKNVNDGIYAVLISFKCVNGKSANYAGSIALIR